MTKRTKTLIVIGSVVACAFCFGPPFLDYLVPSGKSLPKVGVYGGTAPPVVPVSNASYVPPPYLHLQIAEGVVYIDEVKVPLEILSSWVDEQASKIGAFHVLITVCGDEKFGVAMAAVDKCRLCKNITTIYLNTKVADELVQVPPESATAPADAGTAPAPGILNR
jgi:hypothetical protein